MATTTKQQNKLTNKKLKKLSLEVTLSCGCPSWPLFVPPFKLLLQCLLGLAVPHSSVVGGRCFSAACLESFIYLFAPARVNFPTQVTIYLVVASPARVTWPPPHWRSFLELSLALAFKANFEFCLKLTNTPAVPVAVLALIVIVAALIFGSQSKKKYIGFESMWSVHV